MQFNRAIYGETEYFLRLEAIRIELGYLELAVQLQSQVLAVQ
jgi:hypothetical protein